MKHFGTFQEKRGGQTIWRWYADRGRGVSNYLEMVCRQGERGDEYLEKFGDVIYGRPQRVEKWAVRLNGLGCVSESAV